MRVELRRADFSAAAVPTRWCLAGLWLCLSCFGAAAHTSSVPTQKPFNMNVMLCVSPEPAVAFARAVGAAEDEAKDMVDKAAGREVCDEFMGLASIGEVRTLRENGVLYKVTAYRFDGVKAMKWSAIPQN